MPRTRDAWHRFGPVASATLALAVGLTGCASATPTGSIGAAVTAEPPSALPAFADCDQFATRARELAAPRVTDEGYFVRARPFRMQTASDDERSWSGASAPVERGAEAAAPGGVYCLGTGGEEVPETSKTLGSVRFRPASGR